MVCGNKFPDISSLPRITGSITKIADCAVNGNTHYYILLNSSDEIYDVLVNDFVNIV